MNIVEIEANKKSLNNQGVVSLILALAFAVLVIVNLNAITDWIVDQRLNLSEIKKEFKKRDSELQVHLAELSGLRSESDAWDRLTKLKRSARTEEERAFVQSEAAKLRALHAEQTRLIKNAKEILALAAAN